MILAIMDFKAYESAPQNKFYVLPDGSTYVFPASNDFIAAPQLLEMRLLGEVTLKDFALSRHICKLFWCHTAFLNPER